MLDADVRVRVTTRSGRKAPWFAVLSSDRSTR